MTKQDHFGGDLHEYRSRFPCITPTGSTMPVPDVLHMSVQRLVVNVDPIKVVIFGSYAYGKPSPDSDVDVLVVVESDLPYRDRVWSASRCFIPRLFPLNLLVRTPAEISKAMQDQDFFIKEILREGETVYEKTN
jgi:uncharacterized protein